MHYFFGLVKYVGALDDILCFTVSSSILPGP